jgi:hypothetical protein
MNYNTLKDTYTGKSSKEAIAACVKNPTLMRRLVTLHNDKVKIEKEDENPWYDKMVAAGITAELVKDASDFIAFGFDEEKRVAAEIAKKMKDDRYEFDVTW